MSLYNIVNEWLVNNYTPIGGWLYFNATPMIIGTVAMNSVSGDKTVKKYIDGSKQNELIFAIDMVTAHDAQGTSDTNMLALQEVENFSTWLDNIKSSNFPDFGDYKKVQKVEVLTSVPSLLINNEQMLAKYQFQARIIYIDESEVIR